jgi:hypothetical protein
MSAFALQIHSLREKDNEKKQRTEISSDRTLHKSREALSFFSIHSCHDHENDNKK